MINIEIMPAARGAAGYYISEGHAGDGMSHLCNAVTAIEGCLEANLKNTWSIRVDLKTNETSGGCQMRWRKTDREGKSLHRANQAAGFAYTGLKALAEEYPDIIHITLKQAAFLPRKREGETR